MLSYQLGTVNGFLMEFQTNFSHLQTLHLLNIYWKRERNAFTLVLDYLQP